MTHPHISAIFTLSELHLAARELLEAPPDAVVTWRLLREVLRVQPDDPERLASKNVLKSDPWVLQLAQVQLPDGSWGRFHSQDTKQKTLFRTTEEAIDRAFALGLEPSEDPLAHTRQYILDVLNGIAHVTDRDEKHAAWPLGIKFILAGRLAQIDPANPILDTHWSYLAEVAGQAFTSGYYRREDEVEAYLRLSGIHWPQGFLESQHSLRILSTRQLPKKLEKSLINWIWHKPDGIGYLRAPLEELQPRQIGPWLRSMSILSRFTTWREICMASLNQLWTQRDEQGLWDFGSHITRTIDFPLSSNWRKRNNRKVDYSTYILVLLRKYFDDG